MPPSSRRLSPTNGDGLNGRAVAPAEGRPDPKSASPTGFTRKDYR